MRPVRPRLAHRRPDPLLIHFRSCHGKHAPPQTSTQIQCLRCDMPCQAFADSLRQESPTGRGADFAWSTFEEKCTPPSSRSKKRNARLALTTQVSESVRELM